MIHRELLPSTLPLLLALEMDRRVGFAFRVSLHSDSPAANNVVLYVTDFSSVPEGFVDATRGIPLV